MPGKPDAWHSAVLASGCIVSIAYLASWFLEPTRSMWLALDEKVFSAINQSLVSGSPWQVFWAVANNRAFDVVAGMVMIGLYVHFVRRREPERTDFFVAVGLMLTGMVLAASRISAALMIERHSPTAVHPEAFRLSELVSWIPTKDISGDCFPGDHAVILLIWAGVITFYLPRAYACAAWVLTVVFTIPRIMSGAHWLTDVLVGSVAVAGFVLSYVLASPLHGVVTSSLERVVKRTRALVRSPRRTGDHRHPGSRDGAN